MVLLRAIFLWVGCVLFSFACQVERGQGLYEDIMVDGGIPDALISDGQVDTGVGARLVDASGYWVLLAEDHKCINSEIAPSVENLIWSTYLVRIEESPARSGAFLEQSFSLCAQTLTPLPLMLRTVVPPAIPAGLPERLVKGVLGDRSLGGSYVTEEFVDLWGAEALPRGAELPVDATHPNLYDHDGDGEPGVTLSVVDGFEEEFCELQVVQRTTILFSGHFQGDGRITGRMDSIGEKAIISSTNPICENGDLGPSFAPGRFAMRRIAPLEDAEVLDQDGDGQVGCLDLDLEAELNQLDMVRFEPDDTACE